MITITFPDRDTQADALGFLMGRFAGRALKTGEVIVPEHALPALAAEGYQFTVLGRTTNEQHFTTIRDIVASTV